MKYLLLLPGLMFIGSFLGSAMADDQPAKPERESYAGALLGAAISTTSGGSNVFIFSGRIGTALFSGPTGIFSLGLDVAHDSSSQTVSGVTASGNSTPILAELITRRAFGTGLYIGARIGVSIVSITLSAGSNSLSSSATAFEVGPVAGYEFPIASNLAIDLDAGWLATPGTTFNFAGLGSIETSSASALTFQGGLTYHW